MSGPALRGVAGRFEVDASIYGRLRAKPDQPIDAPIIVRVVDAPGGAQVVEYLGTLAGEYDLLGRLERLDGRALADVPPIKVSVVSTLPAERATDLAGEGATAPEVSPFPIVVVILVAALWILLPIAAIVRRRARPRAAAPVVERPPTIPEEIAALARQSRARPLTVDERGRLELMLMRFWRERLRGDASNPAFAAIGLSRDASDADIIRALRDHPAARDLIRAVEAWLHRAPHAEAAGADAAAVEIDRFLEREMAVIGAPVVGAAPIGAATSGTAPSGLHAASRDGGASS